jgi:hypothetical protein
MADQPVGSVGDASKNCFDRQPPQSNVMPYLWTVRKQQVRWPNTRGFAWIRQIRFRSRYAHDPFC